ncbi:O-succinylbenzoate-CoA synthase [Escherichia coli]|nr:O-succinylbenzoate-CoA synthase [Escherichia coli]OZP07391.1 O-succinylbenzoate-CoA synthase [Escherichia coli]
MRSAQVYRWQIPMDAGVVLRDRRLKTRDGLYVCLREGEREGWGRSPISANLRVVVLRLI